jgi:hypothetical protein
MAEMALHQAAGRGDVARVRRLVATGANPNPNPTRVPGRETHGRTLLHQAATGAHVEVLRAPVRVAAMRVRGALATAGHAPSSCASSHVSGRAARAGWRRGRQKPQRAAAEGAPVELVEGRALSELCSWQIGGPARFAAEAHDLPTLRALVRCALALLPTRIVNARSWSPLARGSNLHC